MAAVCGWDKFGWNPPAFMVSYINMYGNVLQFWMSTGTVNSELFHPRFGRVRQLFRRAMTMEEVPYIFRNPRLHTGRGYSKRRDMPSEEELNKSLIENWPCFICGSEGDCTWTQNSYRSLRRCRTCVKARHYTSEKIEKEDWPCCVCKATDSEFTFTQKRKGASRRCPECVNAYRTP